MGAEFLAALRAALPDLRVLTDAGEVEAYRYDETEYLHPGVPLGVAFPASTADVATIVRLAAAHGVPLVPRGAGTGLSGGATGVEGALTVVMTGMAAILEIDQANLVAVVQPGVINADLGRAAAAVGLFYAPDPASFETCTIGGNLAEDSGGLRCLKYGVTRDAVLGLEVVLADGTVIRTGGKTIKDVAGYDLTHLFIGSEGTLGIITEATLRLHPGAAAQADPAGLLRHGPRRGAGGSRDHGGRPRAGDPGADGPLHDPGRRRGHAGGPARGRRGDADDRVGRGRWRRPTSWTAPKRPCRAAGATETARAADATEADWLREARRKAHWSLEQAGVARMDDVGVPRSRVPELLDAIEGISAEAGLPVGVFGHAGDGNLHPTFVVDRDDPTAEARINAARARIYEAAIALGGTITGEHGTGVAKRAYLEAQRGPDAVRVMRAVKAALDPLGILNPGKVL